MRTLLRKQQPTTRRIRTLSKEAVHLRPLPSRQFLFCSPHSKRSHNQPSKHKDAYLTQTTHSLREAGTSQVLYEYRSKQRRVAILREKPLANHSDSDARFLLSGMRGSESHSSCTEDHTRTLRVLLLALATTHRRRRSGVSSRSAELTLTSRQWPVARTSSCASYNVSIYYIGPYFSFNLSFSVGVKPSRASGIFHGGCFFRAFSFFVVICYRTMYRT